MQVFREVPVQPDTLDCLMETANLDYSPREALAAGEALCVRDNGQVIFALAFEVYDCPHGKELHVTGINGTRAKGFQWVKIALDVLDQICERRGIKRLTVMVESDRIRQLLDRIGQFSPMATLVGRFL